MKSNWFSIVIFMDIHVNKMYSFMDVRTRILRMTDLKNESFRQCYRRTILPKSVLLRLSHWKNSGDFSSRTIRVNLKFRNIKKELDE